MFAVPENTVALPQDRAILHPARVALQVAHARQRWGHLLRYDAAKRFAALVERSGEQEIWLISWLPGQDTPLHDHGNAAGAFTVVSGILTETVHRRPISFTHQLVAGQSRAFGPRYTHQVRNEGSDPAITIHVYRNGPRLTRPVRY